MTHIRSFAHGMLQRWVTWLMLLFVIVFLVVAIQKPGRTLAFDNEAVQDFSTGWVLVDETGTPVQSEEPLELPTQVEAEGAVRIAKTVPEGLAYPVVLGFRTAHQQVRLFCDGALLYSFGIDELPQFGKSPGSAWNFVRLPQDSTGKQLILELDTPYPTYRGQISSIQVGSKASLVFSLLRQYTFSFLLTSVIFVTGIITWLLYVLVIRKDSSVSKETLYLGLFSIFVAVWMFGEGRLTQFFSIPPAINTYVTFIAMLITPLPLLHYMGCGRGAPERRLLNIVSKLLTALLFGSLLLQACGILDFIEQLPMIHSCFILSCVVMLYVVVVDTWKRPSPEQYQLLFAISTLALFFILETVRLYLFKHSVGDMMRIGVLVFIVIQAQGAFRNASNMMRMSRLASVDALTGCLNRTAYIQWMTELDGQSQVGVVIADINDLKMINDTYGHVVGDDAITRCAKCFAEACAPYGRCFRIGGDEFAMLGQKLTLERLQALEQAFAERNQAEQEKVDYPFQVSCGLTLYDPKHDQSLSDTVRRADKMMYQNKRHFKHSENKEDQALHEVQTKV